MTQKRGVVVLMLFGAVLGGCSFSIRDEPDPISLPASACPALVDVSRTAEASAKVWQKTEPFVSDGIEWKQFQHELAFTLPSFADALRRAGEVTPEPLASDLHGVLKQVEIGMRELPQATGFLDYTLRTDNAIMKGTWRLWDASDRVGTACGFTKHPLLTFGLPTSPTTRARP